MALLRNEESQISKIGHARAQERDLLALERLRIRQTL
jgi:hypothetical protein